MTDPSSTFKPASLADFGGQIGRRSRPRLFIRLVFALFAFVLIIGIGVILWQRGRTATEPRTAVLTEVNGLVELRSGANGEWQTAAPGTVLQAGYQVRTDTGATALITYFEGSITRMGVETSLELTDLSARQDNRWTSITFTQLSGHTDQLVLPLPSDDSRFEVTTAAAVIRVRGTAYQITVDDNGDTHVDVTQGQVIVASGDDEHTLSTGESLLVPFSLVEVMDDASSTPATTPIPPAMPMATPTTTPFSTLAVTTLSSTVAMTTTTTLTTTSTVTPTSTPTSTPTRPVTTLVPPTLIPVVTLRATATVSLPTPQPTRHDDDDEDEDEDEGGGDDD